MFNFLSSPRGIALLGVLVLSFFLIFGRPKSTNVVRLLANSSTEVTIDVNKIAAPLLPNRQVATTIEHDISAKGDNFSKQNAEGETAKEQTRILSEIFSSHNDNDLRMDHELRILGPEAKSRFRQIYQGLPRENHNDRGTIVFLLGRNLIDQADFDFLRDVLHEDSCQSLSDCHQPQQNIGHEDESQSEVALNYPQAVALESIDRFIASHPSLTTETQKQLMSLLMSALHSNIPLVSKGSRSLLGKIKS